MIQYFVTVVKLSRQSFITLTDTSNNVKIFMHQTVATSLHPYCNVRLPSLLLQRHAGEFASSGVYHIMHSDALTATLNGTNVAYTEQTCTYKSTYNRTLWFFTVT